MMIGSRPTGVHGKDAGLKEGPPLPLAKALEASNVPFQKVLLYLFQILVSEDGRNQ